MIQAHRHAAAILALLGLTACHDSMMQPTNAAQQDQLNDIAANTSETDGSGPARDPDDLSQGSAAATQPRRY